MTDLCEIQQQEGRALTYTLQKQNGRNFLMKILLNFALRKQMNNKEIQFKGVYILTKGGEVHTLTELMRPPVE